MRDSQDLVADLSTGLRPVRSPPRLELIALLWLLASAGFVVAVTLWFGPIRSTALAQLATEPRFLAETALGALAIAWVAVVAFRAAVPGALSHRFATLSVGLMLLWLASYVVGLVTPALEPSMLGKRDHCFIETLLFALPPALLAYLLMRRLYPLRPVYAASWLSLAAGMLPALYMQIACMYEPLHILQMHILPGLLVMLVGSLLTLAVVQLTGRVTS